MKPLTTENKTMFVLISLHPVFSCNTPPKLTSIQYGKHILHATIRKYYFILTYAKFIA